MIVADDVIYCVTANKMHSIGEHTRSTGLVIFGYFILYIIYQVWSYFYKPTILVRL